jgi:hypothetical protein
MAKSILKGKYFCGACIVGCGRSVAIDHGEFAGVEGAGPEYETMALFGSNILVDDLGAVGKAHELCNRYGLDVISTGGVIGFALEAAERGILKGDSDEETDLAWGNGKGIVNLVEKIGRREGLGHLLGEGVMRTSAKLGRGSEAFAIYVKGLEPPGRQDLVDKDGTSQGKGDGDVHGAEGNEDGPGDEGKGAVLRRGPGRIPGTSGDEVPDPGHRKDGGSLDEEVGQDEEYRGDGGEGCKEEERLDRPLPLQRPREGGCAAGGRMGRRGAGGPGALQIRARIGYVSGGMYHDGR